MVSQEKALELRASGDKRFIEVYRGCLIIAERGRKRGKRKKGAIFPWYTTAYGSPCLPEGIEYGNIANTRSAIDRRVYGATREEAPTVTGPGGAAANLAFIAEQKAKQAEALAASQLELERVRAGWLGEEKAVPLIAKAPTLAELSVTTTVADGWERAEEVKRVAQEPVQTRAAREAAYARLAAAKAKTAERARLEQEAAEKYRERATPLSELEREIHEERREDIGGAELREKARQELRREGLTEEEMVTPGFGVVPPVAPPLVPGLDFAVDSAVKKLLLLGIVASIVRSLASGR